MWYHDQVSLKLHILDSSFVRLECKMPNRIVNRGSGVLEHNFLRNLFPYQQSMYSRSTVISISLGVCGNDLQGIECGVEEQSWRKYYRIGISVLGH